MTFSIGTHQSCRPISPAPPQVDIQREDQHRSPKTCVDQRETLITNTREIINDERPIFLTFDTSDIRSRFITSAHSPILNISRLSTLPFCGTRYSFAQFILRQSRSLPARHIRRSQDPN